MAKYEVKRGATSVMIRVFIQSNAVSTGAGLTGLTTASTNLQISMIRELSSTPEVYSGADFETITTCGTYAAPTASTNIRFKAIDATNMPGWYELQFHNSANQGFGSGDASRYVNLFIFEATTTALNLAPLPIEIELVAVDNQDAVRLGLTALPNAAAEASGGLYTRGTGAGQINQPANGMADMNVVRWSGTAVATPDTAGYPKVTIKSGTGTGEVSLSSGVASADAVKISGDSTAADNLETMLDGTGGQALSLGKLNLVDLSGSGATINILNAHDGPALAMQASTSGTTGVLDIKCNGTGPAVHWYGGDYSIRLDTLGDGIWIDTVPGKACIRLVPPGSGSAITFEQGSAFTGPMIQGSIDFENFVDNMIDAGSLASDTITAAKIATGAVDADALAADAANEIADAYLNRTDGIETGVTPKGATRAILATTTGVITDAATTTNTFKNPAGTATRVTSATDTSGNRSAVTLNV